MRGLVDVLVIIITTHPAHPPPAHPPPKPVLEAEPRNAFPPLPPVPPVAVTEPEPAIVLKEIYTTHPAPPPPPPEPE